MLHRELAEDGVNQVGGEKRGGGGLGGGEGEK